MIRHLAHINHQDVYTTIPPAACPHTSSYTTYLHAPEVLLEDVEHAVHELDDHERRGLAHGDGQQVHPRAVDVDQVVLGRGDDRRDLLQ